MKKILAIGAHYDDVEIGVGGTLLKHTDKGDDVFIAVTSSDAFRTGAPTTRHREQLDSLSVLGINEQRLLLFKTDDDVSEIIRVLDSLKSDIIYAPFELDTHQAHRRCSYVGQSVGRALSTQAMFYNSGTSYDFVPHIFSIISFDSKQKLLRCFQSQIELNILNIDIIQRRESYWASLITKEFNSAEGFITRKMIYLI